MRSSRPGERLASAMHKLVQDLRRDLPRALDGADAHAVHDARVATRRLGAALGLLQPLLPRKATKPLDRALCRARHRLGSLRDLQVMLDHLRDLRHSAAHHRPAAWAARLIADRFHDERKKLRKKLPADEAVAGLRHWPRLEPKVRDLGGDLYDTLAQSLSDRLAVFAERAEALGTATRTADGERGIDAAHSGDGPHADFLPRGACDLHALRIAGKKLRYDLELAAVIGRDVPAETRRAMKRMQDALGQWHDDLLLSEAILRHAMDQQLGLHDRALYAQLLELSRTIRDRGEAAVSDFVTTWRSIGDEVKSMIQTRQILSVRHQAADIL